MQAIRHEADLRRKLAADFPFFAKHCLKISTKAGGLSPLILNKAQTYLHNKLTEQYQEKGMIRAIALKGRQQGISTEIEGRFFWRVIHKPGVNAFILTHKGDATDNLYKMVKRYYDNCPAHTKPDVNTHNAKELNFTSLDSGYKVGTAGNKEVGRSATIQYLHGSEVAYWDNAEEHAAGILQAVPRMAGSEIIFESTANGQDNYFYRLWRMAENGESDFIPIFIPWYWQTEYATQTNKDFDVNDHEYELKELHGLSDAQIYWRRLKISEFVAAGVNGDKKFQQEYPFTAAEAFLASTEDALIDSIWVERARKCEVDASGPLIIGVDPAWHGEDKTAIIKRKTRCAYDLQLYNGKDTMQVVGIILGIIEKEMPAKMFIDSIGIGAGIVDRLRELGYGRVVQPVNAGETHSINKALYRNKSAEMWDKMRQWLEDEPVSIPDDDGLHAELCSRKAWPNSNQQLTLESKADMKTHSPDRADALALTFAFPIYSTAEYDNIYTTTRAVSGLM